MSSKRRQRAGEAGDASGKPDIWSQLLEDIDAIESGKEAPEGLTITPERQMTYIVMAGSGRGGKSTLKAAFLKLKDRPKPTVGLDYTFGRRAAANASAKDIAHLWEVGGSNQTDLASLPLTANRLPQSVLVLVVDLSKPGNVVATLRTWLEAMRAHTERLLDELRRTDPAAAEECHRRAHAGLTAEHVDASRVDPLPLRLVVAATHLDALDAQPLPAQNLVLSLLRYVAHMHNGWLVCTKEGSTSSLKNFADAMTCLAFNSSRRRERNADASKPLYIPGGSDSLEAIGGPPGATPESLITSHWARRWDIWQQAVRQHFKAEPEEGAVGGDEEGKEEGFAEADVDKARARKDTELEQYRVEAERRRQLEANAPAF